MPRISVDMVRRMPRARAGLTAALVTVLVLSGCGKGHDSDAASQSGRLTSSSGGTRVDDAIAAESPMSASGSPGPVDRGHASSRDSDRAGSTQDGSSSSDRPSDPGHGASNTAEPTRADLHQALLTPRQLPAGWSASDSGADSDDQVCDFDLAALAGVPAKELINADVRYAVDESSGPAVAEVIGYLPGHTDGLLDALRPAFDDCDGEQAQGMRVRVDELDFPRLGDDSAAYQLRLDTGSHTLEVPLVYAVSGDLAIGLYAVDLNSNAAAEAMLERYAPRAVDRAVRMLT
jgi:hypothetical protein